MFLLLWDSRRLVGLLVLNRPAGATGLYEPYFSTRWRRRTAVAAKVLFIVLMLILPFMEARARYRVLVTQPPARPFAAGVYDVVRFVVNRDTVPALLADSVRWKNVIFDNAGQGSVNTTDPVFWRRYGRGYFRFKADTVTRSVVVWKTSTALDSTFLFTMRYELPDSSRIRLWTALRNDSLYVELRRTARHFQLSERQFHWLSEYNR